MTRRDGVCVKGRGVRGVRIYVGHAGNACIGQGQNATQRTAAAIGARAPSDNRGRRRVVHNTTRNSLPWHCSTTLERIARSNCKKSFF